MAQSIVGTPWEAIRPEPEVAEMVARSLDRPEEMATLSQIFLDHLSALIPGRPEGVLTLPSAERLLAGVLTAVTRIAEPSAPDAPARAEAELGDLGAWLRQAGLDPDGMRSVGYALVRTAREGAGPQWTTAVGSAWSAVQAWMVAQLLDGAHRQPTLVTPMTPIPVAPATRSEGPSTRSLRFLFGRRR
ncbi:MAG: hypothetical protein P8Z68_03020 [Kineosporiaceae bacterium]|jgi:hypothetical protein